MSKKLFSDELLACWLRFNTEMSQHGYPMLIKDTVEYRDAGYGTVAVPSDTFSPTVELYCFHYDNKISIEVYDRHGSPIIGSGRTLGYYRFNGLDVGKVKEACDHIIATFGQYNIDNPVPPRFEKEEITY